MLFSLPTYSGVLDAATRIAPHAHAPAIAHSPALAAPAGTQPHFTLQDALARSVTA